MNQPELNLDYRFARQLDPLEAREFVQATAPFCRLAEIHYDLRRRATNITLIAVRDRIGVGLALAAEHPALYDQIADCTRCSRDSFVKNFVGVKHMNQIKVKISEVHQ